MECCHFLLGQRIGSTHLAPARIPRLHALKHGSHLYKLTYLVWINLPDLLRQILSVHVERIPRRPHSMILSLATRLSEHEQQFFWHCFRLHTFSWGAPNPPVSVNIRKHRSIWHDEIHLFLLISKLPFQYLNRIGLFDISMALLWNSRFWRHLPYAPNDRIFPHQIRLVRR